MFPSSVLEVKNCSRRHRLGAAWVDAASELGTAAVRE